MEELLTSEQGQFLGLFERDFYAWATQDQVPSGMLGFGKTKCSDELKEAWLPHSMLNQTLMICMSQVCEAWGYPIARTYTDPGCDLEREWQLSIFGQYGSAAHEMNLVRELLRPISPHSHANFGVRRAQLLLHIGAFWGTQRALGQNEDEADIMVLSSSYSGRGFLAVQPGTLLQGCLIFSERVLLMQKLLEALGLDENTPFFVPGQYGKFPGDAKISHAVFADVLSKI